MRNSSALPITPFLASEDVVVDSQIYGLLGAACSKQSQDSYPSVTAQGAVVHCNRRTKSFSNLVFRM